MIYGKHVEASDSIIVRILLIQYLSITLFVKNKNIIAENPALRVRIALKTKTAWMVIKVYTSCNSSFTQCACTYLIVIDYI